MGWTIDNGKAVFKHVSEFAGSRLNMISEIESDKATLQSILGY